MNGTKKKIILIIAVIVLGILLLVARLIFKMQSGKIPDTNGDSKELCSIDDEFIESWTHNYSVIKHSVKRDASIKSGIKGTYEEMDCAYLSENFGSLSGIYVCNAYFASDNEVSYMVSSAVNSGNFRIVLTNSADKIVYDIPIDTTHQFVFETIPGETYYLKLIGESANAEVRVTRN